MSYTPEIKNKISILNSTIITPISGGTIFQGTGEDVSKYGRVGISVWTPFGESTDGILTIEVSRDNVNWGGPTRDYADTSIAQPHMWNIVEKYFRIKYTQGTTSATTLQIQTQYSVNSSVNLGQQLNDVPLAEHEGINVKAILAGRVENNTFKNINATSDGSLNVSIRNPRSAFGEISVMNLTPIIQVNFPYDVINFDLLNTGTTTAGSLVIQQNSKIRVETGAAASRKAMIRTNHKVKYRPGQGVLARLTAIFTTGVVNSFQIAGIGTIDDGYYFGYSGVTFGITHINDSVKQHISQTDWNNDTLDGSGDFNNPSNMLLDPTKGNVYQIQYQWLGFGAIKYYIEHSLDGDFLLVHTQRYANKFTTPSVSNPTLEMMLHAENLSNTSNLIMESSSMSAFIEGKEKIIGPTNATQNSKTHSTETTLFSLSARTTYGGKINQINTFLEVFSVGNDVNQLATFRIWEDAVIGGTPVYTNINDNNSVISVDTAGTTRTGGKLLFAGVVGKDNGQTFNIKDLKLVIRPGHKISVTSESNSSGNMSAAIVWVEDF